VPGIHIPTNPTPMANHTQRTHRADRATAGSSETAASHLELASRQSQGSSTVSLDQPLLTVDGVAELLAMSPSSVYYLKDNGDLPYVLLGKRIRFSKQDIELYLAGCRRGPRAA
jgi:excisionase family DNA binding protein